MTPNLFQKTFSLYIFFLRQIQGNGFLKFGIMNLVNEIEISRKNAKFISFYLSQIKSKNIKHFMFYVEYLNRSKYEYRIGLLIRKDNFSKIP